MVVALTSCKSGDKGSSHADAVVQSTPACDNKAADSNKHCKAASTETSSGSSAAAAVPCTTANSTWTSVLDYQLSTNKQAIGHDILALGNVLFAVGRSHDVNNKGHWMVLTSSDAGTTWTVSDQYQRTLNAVSEARSITTDGTSLYVAGYAESSTNSPAREHWIVRKYTNGVWSTSDDFNLSATVADMAYTATYYNGNIYVGGFGTDVTGFQHAILRKLVNGVWSTVDDYEYVAGKAIGAIQTLAFSGNVLYAGGWAWDAANTDHCIIRKYENGAWTLVLDYQHTAGRTCYVNQLYTDANGYLYASLAAMDNAASHWVVKKSVNAGNSFSTLDDVAGYAYGVFENYFLGYNAAGNWIVKKGTTDVDTPASPISLARRMMKDSTGNYYSIGGNASIVVRKLSCQ
mgnify:CR=1 FL=1